MTTLNTAVSGLLSHQRQLDVVANNIANQNTTGFKTQRVVFSDLIYTLSSPATNGNGVTVGGTNPIQIGTGVRTAQTSRNFAQGGFESTGQPLDFAIQGAGFFVLNDGNQDFYTRSGAFSLDASGILIDPATGFPVQRFGSLGENNVNGPSFQVPGDDRIRVPLGETILGEATSSVAFDGNLSADAEGPRAQVLTSSSPFRVNGAAASATTLLNDLDSIQQGYQVGDSIEIEGTNADGSNFTTTLAVDGTTNLGDLLDEINAQLEGAFAEIDSEGNIVSTDDSTGPSLVSLSIDDAQGNVGELNFQTHRLLASTIGQDGDVLSGETSIFDIRGGERTLDFQFQNTGDNLWALEFTLADGEGTIQNARIDDIEFSADGQLIGVNGITGNTTAEFTITDNLGEQFVAVDLLQLNQVASEFSLRVDQDGTGPDRVVDARINSDGVLQGITSAGDSFDLARVALALFSNPQGLVSVGNSHFEASLNSGTVELGAAASSGRGTIRGGELEGANVDVAFEFTQLIVAQRGFSANARSITVADELLEEVTNIIR